MIRTVLLAAAACVALPALAMAEPVALTVDPSHTSVRVEWPHTGHVPLLIAFPAFEGEVMYDPENVENSSVTFTVDTSALWTGVPLWDEHLADPERPLLQTATYPTATFTSISVTRTGDNTATLTGDLTVRDQTHPVTFEVTMGNEAPNPRSGAIVRGFMATATISRSQFGVEQAAEMMGDDVKIIVATELQQAAS
jgi:polyisoprenoid-binding protein YceI